MQPTFHKVGLLVVCPQYTSTWYIQKKKKKTSPQPTIFQDLPTVGPCGKQVSKPDCSRVGLYVIVCQVPDKNTRANPPPLSDDFQKLSFSPTGEGVLNTTSDDASLQPSRRNRQEKLLIVYVPFSLCVPLMFWRKPGLKFVPGGVLSYHPV